MEDPAFCSASELAAAIRSRKLGCLELLDVYTKRIERYNPRINAVIAMDLEGARKRAAEADAALARGVSWGPLHGVPMTIKDSFDVAGLPSTWGVPELANNRPVRNALAVDRFLDAGAIILGKTNVAAYLIGWATRNDVYGATSNPWDTSRSPGGAAGGAAAAIAGGLSALDIGVDFGGGVRNVAHYTGIYGLKPTYGTTNLVGHVMPGVGAKPDLAVTGPMARSPDDLELALSIMAGPDAEAASAWRLELPPPRFSSVGELRIAVMLEHASFPVDEEVQERIEAVAEHLAEEGAHIDMAARPAIDMVAAFRVFGGLLLGGVAMRQIDEKFWSRMSHLTSRFFGKEGGADPLRHVMTHAEWLMFDNSRHLICAAWADFFREYDLLLCPAAPTVAVPHDPAHEWHQRQILIRKKATSVVDPTFWGGFTTVANLPSVVAPAGFTSSGLPCGVQIVGPAYADLTCIALARHLENCFQAFAPPPHWE
jgi:amidase